MNRHTRRASKKQKQVPVSQQGILHECALAKPGFMLRMFSKIVLSNWVLQRVSHPDVERALATVAEQVGQLEIARNLHDRVAMRGSSRT